MTWHACPKDARPGRFVPRVEALEDRCLPACNFLVRGSTLFILAPTTPAPPNETIIVSDNGGTGANNVVAFCRQPFFPNVPISAVEISSGAGNDRVEYNLIGDLVTSRRLDANLGAGNDNFLAVVRRNILTGGNLSLNVNGGPGNDRLQAVLIGSLATNANLQIHFDGGQGNNVLNLFSASFVNVSPGANLGILLDGNGFSDHVFSEYQGVLNGTIQVNATGGSGPNRISSDIELATGSTGRVLPSSVVGGHAHDKLFFFVHNPGTASANNLVLDGRGGLDDAFRTSNVAAFNVATDTVVP